MESHYDEDHERNVGKNILYMYDLRTLLTKMFNVLNKGAGFQNRHDLPKNGRTSSSYNSWREGEERASFRGYLQDRHEIRWAEYLF